MSVTSLRNSARNALTARRSTEYRFDSLRKRAMTPSRKSVAVVQYFRLVAEMQIGTHTHTHTA